MRVLALIPSFFGWTGNAVNERQLLTALAKKVEKCYVITFVGFKQVFTDRRRELKVSLPKNIMLIPLLFPQVHILIIYLAMIVISCIMSILGLILCALKKINLVYIRNSFLSMGFLTFKSLAEKTIVKIPAIIEDEIPNNGLTKFFIGKAADLLDRLTLAKARKVAVNNKSLYDEIIKRRFLKHRDNPVEIPPGVNLQTIRQVKKRISREPHHKFINVGFIGSLNWWQGVDILVKAVTLLRKKITNLRLVIIGDGELRPLIEKTCKASNTPYEITGFLPHEEALRRLAMLDVLVLPSRKMTSAEFNIPIKVIEAWALGIPVIVTRHHALIRNNIRNFEHVIYCKPEPINVANCISTLLNNDYLKSRLKVNGEKLVGRFDYDKIAEKLLMV